jgi:transposase
MAEDITWVGIDDDKRKLTVAVLRGSRQREPEVQSVENDDRALRRWVRRLEREAAGGEIRMCYEAGTNGFALKRRLEAMGSVVVEVMAPTLTPRRAGQRVKTDPLDACKLAQLFRAGELTEIAVPCERDEAARDLVRTYHRVGQELTRKRHHLLKLLLRRGRIYREGKNWTQRHRAWLAAQHWDDWKDAATYEELTRGLRELEDRQGRLLRVMARVAGEETWALATTVLRCFQGIDTGAALTLVTEIFAVERFRRPRDLMSYLGLTPSLYQSADRESRGGITKTGNRYARWVLGQVAWHYRHRVQVGKALQHRRRGQPTWAIAIADRAHRRLHQRYWALLQRGKPVHKVVTAVARELVSFVWEALHEAKVRSRAQARQAA